MRRRRQPSTPPVLRVSFPAEGSGTLERGRWSELQWDLLVWREELRELERSRFAPGSSWLLLDAWSVAADTALAAAQTELEGGTSGAAERLRTARRSEREFLAAAYLAVIDAALVRLAEHEALAAGSAMA